MPSWAHMVTWYAAALLVMLPPTLQQAPPPVPPRSVETNPRSAAPGACKVLFAAARFGAAATCYSAALASAAGPAAAAELYNLLGNALMQTGDLANGCSSYEAAAKRGSYAALVNLAACRERTDDTRGASELLEVALMRADDAETPGLAGALTVKLATLTPHLPPPSLGAVADCRATFLARLHQLLAPPPPSPAPAGALECPPDAACVPELSSSSGAPAIALTDSTSTLGYWLAYHGHDDTAPRRALAAVYAKYDPRLVRVRVPPKTEDRPTVRVGFVSRFWSRHSVGALLGGTVAALGQRDNNLEVVVFCAGCPAGWPEVGDAPGRALAAAAFRVVVLDRDLEAGRAQIANAAVDVLVYSEIGMDPLSYFSALGRLAPVQAAWWGHPDSTGMPSVDYFVTADAEHPDAAAAYSEQLVRLDGTPLGIGWPRDDAPRAAARLANRTALRADLAGYLGLDAARARVYVCVQSLYKWHPRFVAAVAEILRRDPVAVVVATRPARGDMAVAAWPEEMSRRAGDRLLWLPRVSRENLAKLFVAADAVLDTFPFGGGVTTLQTVQAGGAVVAREETHWRGRLGTAVLRELGLAVAATDAAYVELALATATNAGGARERAQRAALDGAGAAASRVFGDGAVAAAAGSWEEWLGRAGRAT